MANHGRTIRIPAHLGGRISKLYQVAQELEQEFGRQPTAEEIAEHMELPAERVRWMLRTSRQPVHLERPVGDESDAELGDFIEDANISSPIDSATGSGLTGTVQGVLAGLTPREAKVLRMRFGIDMNTDHTLEEVGKQFDVTRERIRQIEAKALRKLRHPTRSEQLRSFLDLD